MELTTQQMQTLKTLAAGDPTAAGYMVEANDIMLAEWFNTANTNSDKCWRTMLTKDEMRAAMVGSMGELDNLTVGRRDTLLALVSDWVNANDTGVRQAFLDLTGGSQPATVTRAALNAAAQRVMSRAERALATGPVNGVYSVTWEGNVSYAQASWIRG